MIIEGGRFCKVAKHSSRLLTSPTPTTSPTIKVPLTSCNPCICSSLFSNYVVVYRYVQSTYPLSAPVFEPEILSTPPCCPISPDPPLWPHFVFAAAWDGGLGFLMPELVDPNAPRSRSISDVSSCSTISVLSFYTIRVRALSVCYPQLG